MLGIFPLIFPTCSLLACVNCSVSRVTVLPLKKDDGDDNDDNSDDYIKL